MANLFLYVVCLSAFLALGGVSHEFVADTQDAKIAYVDINSLDSDDGSSDLDSTVFSSPVLIHPLKKIQLNHLYGLTANTFSIQPFHIRAPPYSS
jgi:hypothetical protein